MEENIKNKLQSATFERLINHLRNLEELWLSRNQFYGELPIKESLNPNQKCWINVKCNPEDKRILKREYFGYVFLSEVNN